MNTYPRLTEMGVLHPQQIARFSINSLDFIDFLRIVYDRPTGSLLPVSRTYRFPRIQRTKEVGDDTTQGAVVMESSPAFHEALDELQQIMDAKAKKVDIAAELLDELRSLEEDFSAHSECLRTLVEKIKQV